MGAKELTELTELTELNELKELKDLVQPKELKELKYLKDLKRSKGSKGSKELNEEEEKVVEVVKETGMRRWSFELVELAKLVELKEEEMMLGVSAKPRPAHSSEGGRDLSPLFCEHDAKR